MKSNLKITVTLVTLFLIGGQAFAQTPVLDQRQENQQARIAEGIKSGELTRKEARRLIKSQVQLQQMENKAEADGVVTKKERARLQHKANVESAKIAHNKHDQQERPKAID